MVKTLVWFSLILVAALRPLWLPVQTARPSLAFPGWPATLQNNELIPLPLTEREEAFSRDFPGKIGRFTDGSREIILRWVTKDTRKLHPASDCFRGAGYAVHPLPVRVDSSGDHWGCFSAQRQSTSLRVCERIRDTSGVSFSDTSAWFWAATMGTSSGPWWAETVAEAIR